ncbi:MAG: hypothetical protein MZV63_56000 [Marinilabiliales bacterium]|nr:hypothetical protein [Marinilabiliales bacterium]
MPTTMEENAYATGVALGTPTTGDNCPGETASNNAPAQFPKGTTTVIWTVTDAIRQLQQPVARW